MEGDEVWVVETHHGHGEGAGVHGLYDSREAAWEALSGLPNMAVYVDSAGLLRGRPRTLRPVIYGWPTVWAAGRPMRVRGRRTAVAEASP